MEQDEVPARVGRRRSASDERQRSLETRRDELQQRIEEIRSLQRRLAAGDPLDRADLLAAEGRALAAAQRSVDAHEAAAGAHDQTAALHRRRAEQHGPDEAAERAGWEKESALAERHRTQAAAERSALEQARRSPGSLAEPDG